MKRYAKRDTESLGSVVPEGNQTYYARHMFAMTDEGLFSKSDIAAELAHRDRLIDIANAKIERLRSAAKTVMQTWDKYGDAAADAAEAQDWDVLRKVLSET